MATLVLGIAGGALGSVFGGSVGAIAGRAAGAIAGYALDRAFFGTPRVIEGPRLSDLEVQGSTEGVVIPRLYGRARLAGQVIWATDFVEKSKTETEGGKGGPSVTTTEYSYFANFAVALCEGKIARIGRIWADGKPLDQSAYTFRVYKGGESQEADSLILAKEEGDTPAYRGTAYVVFERMALADFGNRIPQLSFEVFHPLPGIEEHVRAVCVIPGSTEFGYDTDPVIRKLGEGAYGAENAHAARDLSDWTVSLDELQAFCPNLEWVTLVVAWFGDDLRADFCTIRPKVDDATKRTAGATWSVAGLNRETAEPVTTVDGRPAYGGSPSDASVLHAIADLKDRGLKVVLAPFILMDIPAENELPDPESGAGSQAAYPWRGRITCAPAPGRPGSPDKSSATTDIVASFLGAAAPGDFAEMAGSIAYSGPAEWSYRRMVLHYATLAGVAGVDSFLIGSELCALTTLRSGPSTYPLVAGLQALAADVRAIVGAETKISYAADWSEYFGHQPADGSGDVHFHLDPLWADPAVDFVGIDLYHPLTDWRDGPGHLDETDAGSPCDLGYLRSNIRGGEGFDWFYASAEDRRAQLRSPITDGAAGKPWVFRFKDIEAWWSNAHFDRPGGVESATPTAWEPKSKPIWLTELGCPAVDKGGNQPNVFYDPKSAQSALPHFSNGARDDYQQRSYLDAYQRFFDPNHPGFNGSNPVSSVYGGRMVDPAHLHLWAWDARPYPYFPELTEAWSDGGNWQRGHWLNGRLGSITLSALIEAVLGDHRFADFAIADVVGQVGGYLVNEILSARGTLEPLLQAFLVDAADAGDRLLFRGRARRADAQVLTAEMAEAPDEALFSRRRAQETELASEIVLRFIDPAKDYRMSAAVSRRLAGQSRRSAAVELAAVLDFAEAERLSDGMLRDLWTARESAEVKLPPSRLLVEAGDILVLADDAAAQRYLAQRIEDGQSRTLHLRRIAEALPAPLKEPATRPPIAAPVFGPAEVRTVDFAPPDGAEQHAPRLAVFAEPWPGSLAVYRGAAGGGFRLAGVRTGRATMGRLASPLAAGPWGLFDKGNAVDVQLFGGELSGLPLVDVLAGGNAAAIRTASGAWEVLQFASAELIGSARYLLSDLLRGQCGTEQAMATGAESGADFVLLDRAVLPLPVGRAALGLPLRYRLGPARDDHAAPSFTETSITAEGIGMRPFAPVHLRARRDHASGDIALSWIRRTRFDGDGWAEAGVPLNEEREAYRIGIFEGEELRREATVSEPRFAYAADEQSEDFGALASEFAVSIAQLSATVGAGYPLREVVHVA